MKSASIGSAFPWTALPVKFMSKSEKGADFETVCANIRSLASMRREKRPFLMINFLLLSMNVHQAEDIVRLAGRLGIDQVNFKQCDITRGELAKGLGLFGAEETKEIRRYKKALSRAARLARKLKIRTKAFSFSPDELPVCPQEPVNSLFVRYDGAAAPCINLAYGGPATFMGKDVVMPEFVYGQLPETDLPGIWGSEAAGRFQAETRTTGASARRRDHRKADGFLVAAVGEDPSVRQGRHDARAPRGVPSVIICTMFSFCFRSSVTGRVFYGIRIHTGRSDRYE